MYIVADLGGTNLRVARSNDLSDFQEPVRVATPKKYEEGVALFLETAKALAKDETIDAVAMDVPFVLSRDKRSVLNADNLPDWVRGTFVSDVESALGTRMYLENDTVMIGLGECAFGAGRGAEIVVYITVSTGVNGARIVNGRVEVTANGYEVGQQYISIENGLEKWSNFISGRAIERKYGKPPKELGTDHPVWEELARYTAIGVHNTILHWSPDRVVLGGAMFNEVGISVDRVKHHLKDVMKIFPTIPEIVHSELGDLGGLWGGLARLKQIQSNSAVSS